MIKKTITLISLIILMPLMGCAPNVSSNTYEAGEVGVASKVVPGVVIAKRLVNIDANSGAGGVAGVAAGAAAGSTLGGGSAAGNVVGAVGGAVAAGVIGNAIDKSVNKHIGVEYIIRLKKGNIISIVQTMEKGSTFALNQSVLIIYGAMTRIVADTRHSG